MSSRLSDEILKKAQANPDPNDLIIGYHSRRSSKHIFALRKRIKEAHAKFFKFCKEKGGIAVIEPSDFPYGILYADGNRAVPSFTQKK